MSGRVDFRPFNSGDKAHYPLPYSQVSILKTISSLASGGNDSVTITDTDWGADQDFYLTGFLFLIEASDNWITKKGPFIKYFEQSSGEMFYARSLDPSNPLENLSPIDSKLMYSYKYYNFRKATSDQTLEFYVENLTSRTFNTITINLEGVPI